MRIKLLLLTFLIFISFNAFSQESDEDVPNNIQKIEETNLNEEQTKIKEIKTHPATFETDLSLMLLYPWGFVFDLSETLEVPLLRFNNPLTHSNSLKLKAGINLTPITIEADFKATFTPIAFLQLYAGSGIGTGWSFSKFHGFAKNIDDGTGKSKKIPINGKDFFFNTKFGARLQFDLGVLFKHKWSHVVLLMEQGFKYFGAANMTSHDSWVYKEDYGESRNSWLYTASYTIGYVMPIFLRFVGLQIETEKKLYTDPSNKEDWGDQYMYAYITPIIAFEATKYLTIAISPQFFTRKNYIYSVDNFYEKNKVDDSKPHYIEFYRIAIACMFNFKH
ncbi:MAG: hypothetical protein ACTTKH_01605 [Treponema sp.]